MREKKRGKEKNKKNTHSNEYKTVSRKCVCIMSKTIDTLFNSILTGGLLHPAAITDYFGDQNEDIHFNTIYGIYGGLIKYKGVSKLLLENCFKTNRLDELIHKKYTHHKSGYYADFVDKKVEIGDTYFNFGEEEMDISQIDEMLILDDDHCPSCSTCGYYTKKNHELVHDAPPDCFKCENMICKMCSNFDEKEGACICYKCEYPNIMSSIITKISGYRKTDIEKFGVAGNITKEDVCTLLNKQKFRCYVCDDVVLTFGWKPNCFYQFSVDRINNSAPHDRDNVLISCYYCNCIEYLSNNFLDCHSYTNQYKICKNSCHCEKRHISIKREDVSIDKINSLKLG